MSELLAVAVYTLCLVTSCVCALLLIRRYFRARSRLLLSFALGFVGLSVNNLILVADLVLLPGVDLWALRQFSLAAAILIMLYGCLSEGWSR